MATTSTNAAAAPPAAQEGPEEGQREGPPLQRERGEQHQEHRGRAAMARQAPRGTKPAPHAGGRATPDQQPESHRRGAARPPYRLLGRCP
eukprot:5984416-Lingulodinium_polyedra.AAC.1